MTNWAEAWRWPLAWQQTAWAELDPEGLGAWWRQQRLAALLELAARESPLYARRLHCRRGLPALTDCEPIKRQQLMDGFDDWATDRRISRAAAEHWMAAEPDPGRPWLGRYLLWKSSGSSGEPALFVQDPPALAAYDALDGLRLRGAAQLSLPAWGLGRRFAYVGALGERYAGHVNLSRLQAGAALQQLSVLRPMAELVAALERQRPQVLISYPSFAVALAERQLAGGLGLDLQEIWLGGEQLGPGQRELLQQAFGCPLRNAYGASECYAMAFECEAGQALHLNADWLLLEIVDADGQAVADGGFGERCWLSNLANQVQPLLRYELSDRVRRLPGRCVCGSAWPRIELQGRDGEIMRLPARQAGQTVSLLPLAFETLLEQRAGIACFQLVRDADGALELRLGNAERAAQGERCLALLRDWLQELGAAPPVLRLGRSAPRRDAGSGKLRRLIDAAAGSPAAGLRWRKAGPSTTG